MYVQDNYDLWLKYQNDLDEKERINKEDEEEE